MPTTIEFRGSRDDVRGIVNELAAMLAGKRADTFGIAEGFQLSLGFAALSDIKAAFIQKAAGGTDEMGIGWPSLSPKTIANRRVGAGDKGLGKKITRRPGQSTLEAAQQALLVRKWERIRKRETKRALVRFQISGLDEKEALRRARIVGSIKAGKEIGATKVEILGGRKVEILRDTGRLLNSLSPGILGGSGNLTSYSKPSQDGGEDQIFEVPAGEVIVGTNTVYAGTHQHGRQHIPQRKILPDDETPVPPIWWDRWLAIAVQGLAVGAAILFQRRMR
jgi:hypothetical protein